MILTSVKPHEQLEVAMVEGDFFEASDFFGVGLVKQEMDLGHDAIVIGMAQNCSELFIESFVADLKHNFLRLNFLDKISNHGGIFSNLVLVLLEFFLVLGDLVEDVVHKSDCDDFLLVILQLHHVAPVVWDVFVFHFLDVLTSFFKLQKVLFDDSVATIAEDRRDHDDVEELLGTPEGEKGLHLICYFVNN